MPSRQTGRPASNRGLPPSARRGSTLLYRAVLVFAAAFWFAIGPVFWACNISYRLTTTFWRARHDIFTPARRRILRVVGAYAGMVAAALALFLWIRARGEQLAAPVAASAAEAAPAVAHTPGGNAVLHVLLALVAILVAARAVGAIFRWMGQPAVIGEVLAGILLGPSLLGHVAPGIYAFLLPGEVAPFLQVIAQVGVILYMFLVGLELNPVHLRRSPHAVLAISHASILAPFVMGSALALALYPVLGRPSTSFTAFALFLGVSMSVTAFPVLARILGDRRMQSTSLGTLALGCAAVDDVTAWCLLALVAAVVQAEPGRAVVTFGLTLAFIGFVFVAGRPLIRWLIARHDRPGRISQDAMALAFVALLASALATEGIGIHALFGAFLFGAVIPHDSGFARDLRERLEDVVVVLLLPTFFAYSGMRTQIQLVSGASEWLICGAILVVACAGKLGGSAIAGRLAGLGWRDATSLGVLMNTRGLVELIVLNVGLDLGVISPKLFAMLVLMALVTTFATSPILALLQRRDRTPDGDGELRAAA